MNETTTPEQAASAYVQRQRDAHRPLDPAELGRLTGWKHPQCARFLQSVPPLPATKAQHDRNYQEKKRQKERTTREVSLNGWEALAAAIMAGDR